MLPEAKAEKSLWTELVGKGGISELARSPAVKFLQHPGERRGEKSTGAGETCARRYSQPGRNWGEEGGPTI